MNDILPSRKVIAFVLVPVVTVFLLWVIQGYYKSSGAAVERQPNILAATLEQGNREFQDKDTDGDGLKDWEEFLYQTDERVKDTDGDGSSDGVEVRRGYDPLIPGNGTSDEVAPENESGFTFYKNDPDLTKTDLLARDIFVAYSELKQGESLQLETIRDRAIEKAIQENTSVESVLPYTTVNTTAVLDTQANARTYKQAYTKTSQELIGIQFSEIELFSRYVREEDEGALIELEKNKLKYKNFVDSLATVSAPTTIHPIHVELLNNVTILIETIDNMLLVEQDPLLGLVYAQKFLEDERQIEKNTQALLLYFNNNGL